MATPGAAISPGIEASVAQAPVTAPPTGQRGGPASPGRLLALIRTADGITRRELLELTGMSRTTLVERLDVLAAAGLVVEAGTAGSTGGRPAKVLRLNDIDRVMLILDVGQSLARVSVCGLDERRWTVETIEVDPRRPPGEFVDQLIHHGERALERCAPHHLIGVGIALPSPVRTGTSRLYETGALPGWDAYPLADHLARTWPVPLAIENDARAFALGEWTAPSGDSGSDILLGIKFATGLGAGVIVDGHVLRGWSGSAGDIGHMFFSQDGPECTCGRRGCLAAHASGRALLRDLAPRGINTLDELVAAVGAGGAVAEALVAAAAQVGLALSQVVQVVNPGRVVLGGVLGRHPLVVGEIRRQLAAHTHPRVGTGMEVVGSAHAAEAGTLGLCRLLMSTVYAPERIDALVTA